MTAPGPGPVQVPVQVPVPVRAYVLALHHRCGVQMCRAKEMFLCSFVAADLKCLWTRTETRFCSQQQFIAHTFVLDENFKHVTDPEVQTETNNE